MQQEQLQNQLYDIYDVIYHPFWKTYWFFLISVLMGLLIVGVGLYFIVRWLKHRKLHRTYWQQVLDDLACVRNEIEQGKVKPDQIYKQMIAILKEYCSLRYGINMRGFTDTELIIHLEQFVSSDQLAPLKMLTPRAIEVKFAGEKVAKKLMLEDTVHIRNFIEKTVPSENSLKK